MAGFRIVEMLLLMESPMQKPGDIVVIAGKGHEKYQEICGQKFPMDDRQLAMKCKVW